MNYAKDTKATFGLVLFVYLKRLCICDFDTKSAQRRVVADSKEQVSLTS